MPNTETERTIATAQGYLRLVREQDARGASDTEIAARLALRIATRDASEQLVGNQQFTLAQAKQLDSRRETINALETHLSQVLGDD